MSSPPSKAWGQSIRTHQLETLVLPDLSGAQDNVISLRLFLLCRRERRPQSLAGFRRCSLVSTWGGSALDADPAGAVRPPCLQTMTGRPSFPQAA